MVREERLILDTYHVRPSHLKKLRELAQRLGRSKGSLVREAVEELLVRYQKIR